MAHHHSQYDPARPSSQYYSQSFLHSHPFQQQQQQHQQQQHHQQHQQMIQQQLQQQQFHQQSLAHQPDIYPSYAHYQQYNTYPSSAPAGPPTTGLVPSSPPYLFECPNVACPRAYKMVSELNAHLAQTKCRTALTNTSGPPPAPRLLDTHPGPSSSSPSLSSVPSSSSSSSSASLPLTTSAPTPYRQLSGIEAIIHASLRADAEAEAKANLGASPGLSHAQIDRSPRAQVTVKEENKNDADVDIDAGEVEIGEDQDEDDEDEDEEDEDDEDDEEDEDEDEDEDEEDARAAGNQLERTFKCPNFGCSKAYKQSNGLKYHFKKGQCDFGVRDIIAKGASEEQAEKQVRPFVCLVDGCERKYRQQNGLMYHYMNSGEHGHKGIALIEAGVHPHPKGGMIPRYRSIYLHAHKAHYPDPTVTVNVPTLIPSSSNSIDSTALSSSSSSVASESSPSIPSSILVRQATSIQTQSAMKQHVGRIDDDEGTEDALMALVALAGGLAKPRSDPTHPGYISTPAIQDDIMLDNVSGLNTLPPIDGSSHRSPINGTTRGRGRGARGRGTGSGTGRGRGRPRTIGLTQTTLKKTVSPSMEYSPMGELIDRPKARDGILFDCPNTRCVRTYGTKHELTYHITLGRCKYKILDGRSRGGTGKNQDKDSDGPDEIMEKTSFGCPNPGCGKAYKFKKGLINHLEPGVCPFGVIEKEHTPILARSLPHTLSQNPSGISNMTTNESATKTLMLKVAKPYACQAGGGCLKRYALMHGLRYHYSKSGEHGEIGLELLRQGKHQSANGGVFPPTTY
ncbi:FOG: Zn-finger [Phaffia rhodozyma]|uniref:FOG: Zn-finger n=1 Tax=Phaffia rhodozyma TaxID=264483 RepID=A0A0F7SGY9_PHARH|nr:FOG: Zn-finger [Phaffia rhodozyma]